MGQYLLQLQFLLIDQSDRPAQDNSSGQRHQLRYKGGHPDSLRAEQQRQAKNHQCLERKTAADGDGIGRAGSLGGEEIGCVDKIQRHGDKGQRKQRQGCRRRLNERRLLVENTDDGHAEKEQPAVNEHRQNEIDDPAAAEIPVHFPGIPSAVALSPQGLLALGYAGEDNRESSEH